MSQSFNSSYEIMHFNALKHRHFKAIIAKSIIFVKSHLDEIDKIVIVFTILLDIIVKN